MTRVTIRAGFVVGLVVWSLVTVTPAQAGDSCGGNGEACCGLACDPGLVCAGSVVIFPPTEGTGGGAIGTPIGVCVPCGNPGEPCCDGLTCNEGAYCPFVMVPFPCETSGGGGGGLPFPCEQETGGGSQFVGLCAACGDPGQPCCPGNTCDDNALCMSGFCEACGEVGEQCCAENRCSVANAACVEDVCEAGPAAPLLGTTAMLALTGVLIVVGSFSLTRRPRRRSWS